MYITQTLVDLWGRLETHLKKTNEASKIKSATFSVFSPVWTTVLLKEEMEDYLGYLTEVSMRRYLKCFRNSDRNTLSADAAGCAYQLMC